MRLLLLCLLLTSCASKFNSTPQDQSKTLISINIIDREGLNETIGSVERLKEYECVDFLKNQPYQKVLRIFGRDPNGNTHALITSYHENGQPKQYLEVTNNRAFGKYLEWYADGTPRLEANVIGGVADLTLAAEKTYVFEGTNKAYDENQHLCALINYSKGDLEGTSLYFHPNGKIWKSIPFHKNLIEGAYDIFLETGELLQSTNYVSDQKHGKAIRFWSGTDRIAGEEFYNQGDLVSGTYFSFDNEPICSIINGNGTRPVFGKRTIAELHEFKNGVEEGLVKVLNINGELIRTYSVKGGLKHGEEIEYFPKTQGQPLLSINWYEGKVQGIVKTWYKNGQQESQREMSHNMKSGLSTAWYKDGSLMLIEEYDNNKLVKGEYFKMGEKYPTSIVDLGAGMATLFDPEGHFLQKVTYERGFPLD